MVKQLQNKHKPVLNRKMKWRLRGTHSGFTSCSAQRIWGVRMGKRFIEKKIVSK
jgi:hypothetical protein